MSLSTIAIADPPATRKGAVTPSHVRILTSEPSTTFTAAALALGTWLVVGAYVDAWAHHHLSFETFFTPWHALLYSGFAANAAFFGGWWALHKRTLPTGYELSLLGCIAFMMLGAADLVWHGIFGIERDFAAILSPTHLGLMLSTGLIVTGPLRAAWRSPVGKLPYSAAWSLTLLLALLFFFMQDLHPFTAQWANPQWAFNAPLRAAEMVGVDNLVLATGALVGVLLVAMVRFQLRVGEVVMVTAVPATAVVLTYRPDLIIVVAVVAGFFGEAVRALLQPSRRRTWQLRAFVVLFTGFLWSFYMWGLATTDGIWWPIHSEFGVVVVTMIGAWLLTYLACPPRAASSSKAIP